MNRIEDSLQQECIVLFRSQYPLLWEKKLFFAVPNGQKREVKQNKKGEWYCPGGNRSKAMGETSGVSDMILLIPNEQYPFLCIEFKKKELVRTKNGKLVWKYGVQSKEQKVFQASVEEVGGLYKLIYEADAFMELINSYLSIEQTK
jgi:hypothetical protein